MSRSYLHKSIEHKSENGKISTSITKPDEIEIEEL